MPPYLEKRSNRYPFYGLIGVVVLLLGVLFLYNRVLSLVGLLLLFFPLYFMAVMERRQRSEMEEYISTLSHRVKKVGEEALMELPITS